MSTEAKVTLDSEQLKVVHADADKHISVMSSAGTGKTRVLTERIIHLITQKGADPDRILAITFTNFATDEMEKRINQRLSDALGAAMASHSMPNIMTWDTLFLSILNREKFTIPECPRNFIPQPLPGERGGDDSYAIRPSTSIPAKRLGIKQITDLVIYDFFMVSQYADRHEYWKNRYDYIFVDECQDMDEAYRTLIHFLRSETNRFLFVGDTCQHIFPQKKLKKSDTETVFDVIRKDFDGQPEEFRLLTNYRSGKKIVEFSGYYRLDKAPVKAKDNASDGEIFHVPDIQQVLDKWDEMKLTYPSILVDEYEKSEPVLRQLMKKHIHFRCGNFFLFKKKEVKQIVNFLWAIFSEEEGIFDELAEDNPSSEVKIAEGKEQISGQNDRTTLPRIIQEIMAFLQVDQDRYCLLFLEGIEHLMVIYEEQADDPYFFVLNLTNLAVFDKEDIEEMEKGNTKKFVTISTIQKTKGLEWDDVIVWGWNRLASSSAPITRNQTYVAATRARNRLILVHQMAKKPKRNRSR